MSLFSKRWFMMGFLPLIGCGFEPIYGKNKLTNQIMGKIDVEVSNGRDAFELRNRLVERLGNYADNPVYLLKYKSNIRSRNLTISKKKYVTRYTLQGKTTFKLVNKTTKKIIYSNTIVSNTAYSATAGTYQTNIAERDAKIRLSRDMADKIVTLLLITVKDWTE